MMRRYFPIVPTILVGAAIVTMLMLGIWQLERRGEKAQLLATYRTNLNAPPLDRFPIERPVADSAMFRKARVACKPADTALQRGGKDSTGRFTIFRTIMPCRLPDMPAGPDNPIFYVDIGGTEEPGKSVVITRQDYSGIVTTMPPESGFLVRLFRAEPPAAALLIADQANDNMVPSAAPNIADVPNDHLAYAIQWFLFAGFALIIYILALRKRVKSA